MGLGYMADNGLSSILNSSRLAAGHGRVTIFVPKAVGFSPHLFTTVTTDRNSPSTKSDKIVEHKLNVGDNSVSDRTQGP